MHCWPRVSLLTLPALILLAVLPLGACTPDYPMDKPGTWNIPLGDPGSNATNLRVMVANPNDLTAGTGEDASMATEAAPPVSRLINGQRPRLPDTNGTPLGSSGGQTGGTIGQAGTNGSIQQ